MSGIAGILSLDRTTVEADQAERMAARLAWRGPDDDDSYRSPDGRAALAARTLGSAADCGQPLANETHDVWLVLDGSILNHRTLRHSLELAGHRFRTGQPAEVALHAYEQWDLDFPTHLQGAFALALWDDRRDRLVLARDRLGRKPLFVGEHRGRLAFASGIVAVTEALGLPRRVDPAGLADLLAVGHVPAPRSIAAGVTKLAAGEMLVADRGLPRKRSVWGAALPDDRRAAATRVQTLDRHAGNLRTLLECAMADRLMGDRPLAIRLDGGAEAGALAAIASRLAGRPAQAVAVIDAKDGDGDRARDIRRMAAIAGADLTEIAIGGDAVMAGMAAMAGTLAEPAGDSGLVGMWFAAQAAAGMAVDAMVGADGADTILLTHPAFKANRRSGMVHRLRRLLPGSAMKTAGRPVAPPAGLTPFGGSDWRSVLLPDAQRLTERPEAPRRPLPAWTEADDLEVVGLHDLAGRVCDGVVPAVDGMAQAHGLEAHLPFLDDPLVAYALAIPGILRSPAGSPRLIAKRALGDLLPAGIAGRSEPAAGLPLDLWLPEPALADIVARSGLVGTGMIQPELAGVPASALWTLALLALWADANGFAGLGGEAVAPHFAHSRS